MIRRALLPLAGLVALTIALTACSSGGDTGGSGSADADAGAGAAAPAAPAAPPATATPSPTPTTSASLPVDARPTTARGAVEAFLVADVRGDTDASYALLSTPQQQAYSANEWVHAQADRPHYLGFTVQSEQPLAAGGTEVTVTAVLQSQLDEIVGLVPARASATLTAVPEGAEWRIDLSRTRMTPLLPPDADAPGAVAAWVQARQACQPGTGEYRSLVGAPALADALCGAQGEVRTDAAQPLTELGDASPVLNAFGADAATWARVVDVEAPSRLAVVVAPVDDRWLVVGVTSHS
jgi:hypothetical protein